jgi:hypothetical protein
MSVGVSASLGTATAAKPTPSGPRNSRVRTKNSACRPRGATLDATIAHTNQMKIIAPMWAPKIAPRSRGGLGLQLPLVDGLLRNGRRLSHLRNTATSTQRRGGQTDQVRIGFIPQTLRGHYHGQGVMRTPSVSLSGGQDVPEICARRGQPPQRRPELGVVRRLRVSGRRARGW